MAGVGRGHGQSDPARLRAVRQAAAESAPGLPGVFALPDAARRAGDPRVALPGRGVDDRRVRGGDDHVVGPRALVDVEDVFPSGPSVERPVEPPVGIGGPVVAVDGDEGDVRVGRVDVDLADVVGALEAEMAPGGPAVVGPVDPRPRHGEIARLLEVDPRPQPDRLRTRRGQGDVADAGGGLVLEDRLPGQAVVRRLPEPAGAEGGVEGAGPRRVALDAGRPGPVHHRPDRHPFQAELRAGPELQVPLPGPEQRISRRFRAGRSGGRGGDGRGQEQGRDNMFGHGARSLRPYIKELGPEIKLEPAASDSAAAIDLAPPLWYQSVPPASGPSPAAGRSPIMEEKPCHRRLKYDVPDLRASRCPLTDIRLSPGRGRTGRPDSHNFIERQEEI